MKITTQLAALGTTVLAASVLAVTPAHATITTVTVTVPADIAPPGISVMHVIQGDTITISANGSAQYGYQGAPPCGPGYPVVYPDGSEYLNGGSCGKVLAGQGAPLPNQPVGELLHRISPDGGWAPAGFSLTFTAGRTGTLYLIFNDSVYSDNSGHYTVTVTDNSG